MPYVGDCDRIAPAYRKLVGLAIRPGYNQKVKELLGGRARLHPHHRARRRARDRRLPDDGRASACSPADQKPFQLDKCHALESTAPAVAKYYPKWYRGTEPVEAAGEATTTSAADSCRRWRSSSRSRPGS